MKKVYRWVLTLAVLLVGIVSLSACTPKQTDLSGVYYYIQNPYVPNPDLFSIHRVEIRKTDQSNKKYAVIEMGVGRTNQNTNSGKMTVDGDVINIHLEEKSWLLDEGQEHYARGGMTIDDVEGLKFTNKNGVIEFTGQKLKLYNAKSATGKKMALVRDGSQTWSQAFK
jgi:hypothetical protein